MDLGSNPFGAVCETDLTTPAYRFFFPKLTSTLTPGTAMDSIDGGIW
jgi:hypothetical protein